jgi:hypothetical protein
MDMGKGRVRGKAGIIGQAPGAVQWQEERRRLEAMETKDYDRSIWSDKQRKAEEMFIH